MSASSPSIAGSPSRRTSAPKATSSTRTDRTRLDLVKAGRGRLSGAALAIFGWPEMWNGPNAPHKPTPGFVDEARHQQEIRYKILTGMVRDFPNQVGIAYSPRTSAA